MIAATEDVTTTDDNWGPAFSADASRVSFPRLATPTNSSYVVREKSSGEAVWKMPSTPISG